MICSFALPDYYVRGTYGPKSGASFQLIGPADHAVHYTFFLLTPVTWMDRFFNRRRKKKPEPPQRPLVAVKPANTPSATGSSGLQKAETAGSPTGSRSSQIVHGDQESESRTPTLVVGGIENEVASECS